jgi:hypothetical protein
MSYGVTIFGNPCEACRDRLFAGATDVAFRKLDLEPRRQIMADVEVIFVLTVEKLVNTSLGAMNEFIPQPLGLTDSLIPEQVAHLVASPCEGERYVSALIPENLSYSGGGGKTLKTSF